MAIGPQHRHVGVAQQVLHIMPFQFGYIVAAAGINDVHAFEDINAQTAQTFGVYTSGQTLLYGSDGRLLFKGGITASRGHSGDNAGRTVITALLDGEVIAKNQLPVVTPVFGCSLQGE